MQLYSISSALVAAAADTTRTLDTSPFMPGSEAVVVFNLEGFHGTVDFETSVDEGTTWVVKANVTTTGAVDVTRMMEVELTDTVRGNVTAFTAGSVDIDLLG